MMRKKRGYKRETPKELVRDYKLFAIACEGGKREPIYFNTFRHLSNKIAVDVIEEVISDDEMSCKNSNKSSPKWVLDRAMAYIEKEGLTDEDELWFVMDKDRWELSQLREISDYCDKHHNWNVVISNPCFEVWLYFHKRKNIKASKSSSCGDFKQEISTFEKGGYSPYTFLIDIINAVQNAKEADSTPEYFMPEEKETKVYKLVEAILALSRKTELEQFINVTLSSLVKVTLKEKKR